MTETMATTTTTTMTITQAAVLVLRLKQWRSASNKNKKKFDLGALKEIVARAHGRACPPLAGFDSTSLGEESSAGYFSETTRLHLRYYAEDELAGLPGSLILKSQGAYNETFEEMANKVSVFPRSSRLRF